MAPTTMKQWMIAGMMDTFDCLQLKEAPVPQCGENEVLVKFHAVSLNYRDLIIPKGLYPFESKIPLVPCSDASGEVVEVGSKVTMFKKQDKVVTVFHQGHQSGDIDPVTHKTGLGGFIDGCLQEYRVFNEQGLVLAPRHLDHIKASTLSCAALTAWNAFYGLKPLKAGQTVLVQGTGGVSIFGVQLAKAAGATVIATTSSNEKAEMLKQLGADHVINYRSDPNWGESARKLTPSQFGVDHILEVGGPTTLQQSFECIKMEGVISIIGALGGADASQQPQVLDTLSTVCIVRGIQVGNKAQLIEMIRAMEANDIQPVVDKTVFPLDKAPDAYQYLWDQKHVGNVVISMT